MLTVSIAAGRSFSKGSSKQEWGHNFKVAVETVRRRSDLIGIKMNQYICIVDSIQEYRIYANS